MSSPSETWSLVREVFEAALDLPPEARAQHVADACDDEEVRAQVLALLAEHDRPGAFLDPLTGAPPVPTAAPEPVTPATPGTRVGGYVLRDLIAWGGMGTVYEAVQDQPHRTVALKMLTMRLPSEQALRRFRYESEILAHLRHPGIAQVFEAGVHAEGEGVLRREVPWFALELVEGARSLLRFADEEGLELRERLELFTQVCDAVHHGHQRGVIHRDLKPGNILVGADGAPKVIDFGVARATDSDLAATTVASLSSEFAGTLQYMSPEQLDGVAHDLDVRSDVYSLGVVLYELLTGRPPYEVAGRTMPDVARAIREDTPRRPGLVDARLAGDVEWIVMRCLAKERERRYDSASALRDDLQRYLAHQSIEARPPSMSYRVRMFARRNRTLVAASGVVIAVLFAALVTVSVFAWRADREARRFEASHRFFQHLFGAAAEGDLGEGTKIVHLLDEAAVAVGAEYGDDPAVELTLRHTIGTSYKGLGRYEDAVVQLERAAVLAERTLGGDSHRVAVIRGDLGIALAQAGRLDEAEPYLEGVVAYGLAAGGTDASWVWTARQLGRLRLTQGQLQEALAMAELCVRVAEELHGPGHALALGARIDRGAYLGQLGRLEEAEEELHEALDLLVASTNTAGHRLVLSARSALSNVHVMQGRLRAAEDDLERNLADAVDTLGPFHPKTISLRQNLGALFLRHGRLSRAEELLREAHEQFLAELGPDHALSWTAAHNLGITLLRQGRAEEAAGFLTTTLDDRRVGLGAAHPSTLSTQLAVAELLSALRSYADALELYEDTYEARVDELGESHPATLESLGRLGFAKAMVGRTSEAEDDLRAAVARGEEALGPGSGEVLGLRNDLGAVLMDLGRPHESIELLRAALDELNDETRRRTPNALAMASNLGNLLVRTGSPEEGEPILLDTLEAQLEHLGDHHEDLRVTYGNLASMCDDEGREEEAEAYYRAWLDQHRVLFGPLHLRTLSEVTALGFTLTRWGRTADAEPLFREAWEEARAGMPDDWIAGFCAGNLGQCLVDLGRADEGRPLLEEALEHLTATLGEADPRTQGVASALAALGG